MKKFILMLFDFIYKKHCYFCKDSHESTRMCSNCYKKIKLFNTQHTKIIKNSKVYCATFYKDTIKKMIRAVKYHNEKDLVYYQAKIMYDYWKMLDIKNEKYILVAVPMHKKREKKRKYNHMSLVAQEFAKFCDGNLIVESNLIRRIKDTKPQYKLSVEERQKNLKNAFSLCQNYKEFQNKKILIIDDILTTGSTLNEMIKTFHDKNIYDITCLTTACSEFYDV